MEVSLILFDWHPEYRKRWEDRHFWTRGYCVATVGIVNEEIIKNYLK